jgi:hypothetical protein
MIVPIPRDRPGPGRAEAPIGPAVAPPAVAHIDAHEDLSGRLRREPVSWYRPTAAAGGRCRECHPAATSRWVWFRVSHPRPAAPGLSCSAVHSRSRRLLLQQFPMPRPPAPQPSCYLLQPSPYLFQSSSCMLPANETAGWGPASCLASNLFVMVGNRDGRNRVGKAGSWTNFHKKGVVRQERRFRGGPQADGGRIIEALTRNRAHSNLFHKNLHGRVLADELVRA